MNRNFLLFLCTLGTIGMQAENVPQEKAKEVGMAFLNSAQTGTLGRRLNNDLILVNDENQRTADASAPAYYMYNNAGGGFIVVSGDDAVEPILAYSLDGSIDMKNMPDGFKFWLEMCKNGIGKARENHEKASAETVSKWSSSSNERQTQAAVTYPVVTPLVPAKWGQGNPYNSMCPAPGGATTRAVTGCVATAMAQIMYYWKYPATGNGSLTYTPNGYPQQSANFGATNYLWAFMRDSYNPAVALTDTERKAIATLMYHCGVSVHMKYGTTNDGASGSTTGAASLAYENYFRYLKTTGFPSKSNYSIENWIKILKTELDNFRPMQIRGEGSGGKHSWVCDGYDNNDLFHFNWGGSEVYANMRVPDFGFTGDVKVVTGIEIPNRRTISAITSSSTGICGPNQSFTCSIVQQSSIGSVFWTVPAGWLVDGVVSTGGEMKNDYTVTITSPSNYTSTSGANVVISASGRAWGGERTLRKYASIAGGFPSFTYTTLYAEAEASHCFNPSVGARIQYLENGVWKNATDCITLYNGNSRTVTVRAVNSCGNSASRTYKLTSPKNRINSTSPNGTAQVYPNPATETIFINGAEKVKDVLCINTLGQIVEVRLDAGSMDIAHLPKGLYVLNLTMADGTTVVEKFTKE